MEPKRRKRSKTKKKWEELGQLGQGQVDTQESKEIKVKRLKSKKTQEYQIDVPQQSQRYSETPRTDRDEALPKVIDCGEKVRLSSQVFQDGDLSRQKEPQELSALTKTPFRENILGASFEIDKSQRTADLGGKNTLDADDQTIFEPPNFHQEIQYDLEKEEQEDFVVEDVSPKIIKKGKKRPDSAHHVVQMSKSKILKETESNESPLEIMRAVAEIEPLKSHQSDPLEIDKESPPDPSGSIEKFDYPSNDNKLEVPGQAQEEGLQVKEKKSKKVKSIASSSYFYKNMQNHNVNLTLVIQDVTLEKDEADMMGKQDPFISFHYEGREYKTKTIDEGGKHAQFDDEFKLYNIQGCLEEEFQLTCYDEDLNKDEFLGHTQPTLYKDLITQYRENQCKQIKKECVLYNQDFTEETGTVAILIDMEGVTQLNKLYKKNQKRELKKQIATQRGKPANLIVDGEDDGANLKLPSHSPLKKKGKDGPQSAIKKKNQSPSVQGGPKKQPPKKGGLAGRFGGRFGLGKSDDEAMFEPLSFKKLEKIIATYHPVNPDTKDKFNFKDRITVKDYYQKLSDIFCCYALAQYLKQLKKFLKRKLGDKKEKFPKPRSMADLPSSDSSSSDSGEELEEGAKGLTLAAQNLGEGATLYLQSMKTLCIMFIVLTIINMPIFITYSSYTTNNDIGNISQFFKYFTLGNLGQTQNRCSHSRIDFEDLGSMDDLIFACPQGSYISELKYFGFLYRTDKRTNGISNGTSFCHAAEHPLDPVFIVNETISKKANVISDQNLRRLSEPQKRHLQIGNPIKDVVKKKYSSDVCHQCIDNEVAGKAKGYFIQRSNVTQGHCHDDSTSDDIKDAACKKAGDHYCSWLPEKSPYLGIENHNSQASPEFKKALFCPNIPKCQNRGSKIVEISLRETDGYVKMDAGTYLQDGEYCAYWIQPTYQSAETYDYLNVKFQKLDNAQAQVYIIQEDLEGNLIYEEDKNFTLGSIEHHYSFFLNKLQYQKRRQQNWTNIDLPLGYKSYSMSQGETSTSYSLMVLIKNQPDKTQGHFELKVESKIGFKEIITDNTTKVSPYVKYKDDPMWKKILSLENFEDKESMAVELYPNITTFNLDSECQYQKEKDYEQGGNMFMSSTYSNWFTKVWNKHCHHKQNCTFKPGYQGSSKAFDDNDLDQPLDILPKLSSHCLHRMRYRNITSHDFLMILGCKNDLVQVPFFSYMHKENVGIVVVVCDMISLIVIAFFFNKLQSISNEYLEIMDDMSVQMKDFGIKIDNVIVDRYTQDSRVLKMKLWLHMTDLLRSQRTRENDMEVIDVTLSLYTQPSIQCVFSMQKIQLEINTIQQNLFAGVYKEDEFQDKQDEIKALKDKLNRQKIKYKQLTQRKDKSKTTTQKIPKSQRIQQVQYVFICFKNCTTKDVVLEMYAKETGLIKFIKNLAFYNTDQVQQKLFLNRELNVVETLEPDEIIWENLAFSGDEQKARVIVIRIISLIFLAMTTIVTIYISGINKWIGIVIPKAVCPKDQFTKEQAFDDYALPREKQDGLMGCFCSIHTSFYYPWTLFTVNFSDVRELRGLPKKTSFPCLELQSLWLLRELVYFIVSTSAVLINGVIATVFQALGQYQKKHTKIEEQSTSFQMIFFLEFINMGLIQLFSSFDPTLNDFFLGFMGEGMKKKTYSGFISAWYMDVGKSICFFIFMSSFISNSQDLKKFSQRVAWRFYDRSWKLNLKKDPEDEDDDEPNTRKKVQADLEKLYTGLPFKGEKAYSRMMSTLFVIMLYSSGMPGIYIAGVVFYGVTYYANKLFIFKFYKKSLTLTRTIPLFSLKYLKIGLLIHILGACFMLTNPSIFVSRDKNETQVGYNPLDTIQALDPNFSQDAEDGSFLGTFLSRFKYFHQQLYIMFVFFFIFFYLVGKSTYTFMEFIAGLIFSLIKKIYNAIVKQINKVASRAKAKVMGEKFESSSDNDGDPNKPISSSSSSSSDSDSSSSSSFFDSSSSSSEQGNQMLKDMGTAIAKKVSKEKKRIERQRLREQREQERKIKQQKKQELLEQQRRRILQIRREKPDFSENLLQELNCENLSNFYERAKRELSDFLDIFNLDPDEFIDEELLDPEGQHPKKVMFQEICFMSRINNDNVRKYQKFLHKRIKDIETVIGKHFKLIEPCLIQELKDEYERERKRKKKEGLEGTLKQQLQDKQDEKNAVENELRNFKDPNIYTYSLKIQKLVEHQDALIQADKNRKENRRGVQEILRMQGSLTQSYFIFDSQNYKVARKLYFGLEEEEQKEEEAAEDDAQEDGSQQANSQIDDEEEEGTKQSKSSKRSARSKKKGKK